MVKIKCHVCGKGELVQDTRDMPYTYKGRKTVLKGISGEWCPSCGEVFLRNDEIDNFMAAARAFKKEVNEQALYRKGFLRHKMDRLRSMLDYVSLIQPTDCWQRVSPRLRG